MAKVVNIRGLQNFISEIRSAGNKEAEKVRVDKELGKIRKKFAATKDLSEYDKKKYVWKLLYIYMLGYPVEFGHKQASDLIASQQYAEKQVGYMACSILLNEKDEFLRLVINSVRNDIICRNEAFQCLALNFIGSVGGPEMASLLLVDVQELLISGAVRPIVRKKAALALLRLLRKSTSDIEELLTPDVWAVKLGALFEEQNVGVLLGSMSLLLGIVSRNYQGYESVVPKVVRVLEKLRARDVGPDYAYYGIASPWLQVKCLRVLQYFPAPEDPAVMSSLTEILRIIISGSEGSSKNVNKGNAQHAIVFEAIALALAVDANTDLLAAGVALLGKFIGLRDPNLKYLGLENMVRLAGVPAVMETVNRHQKSIISALKEPDISIRRRALDVLFTMCNEQNVELVVAELLTYLTVADFSMREEIVLKTAVLAERFFPSLEWLVDSMVTLIERSGEFATKDIWYSTVQLVTNHDNLHAYAARKVVLALRRGASDDAVLGVAAYILGEYGALLDDVTLREQFTLLQARFGAAPDDIKAALLSSYMKMKVAAEEKDPKLAQDIQALFLRYQSFMDTELQQRALEYGGLGVRPDVAKLNVLAMPHWEKRKSLLLRRLAEKEGEDTDEQRDRPAWMQGEDGTPSTTQRLEGLALSAKSDGLPAEGEAADSAAEPTEEAEADPKVEAESEAVPVSPPAQEEDFLNLLDDGPSTGYYGNGHAKSTNPMDLLLSDMGTSGTSTAAPTPSAPEDPFSSMADRPSYVKGYSGAAYGGSASGYGGSGSGYGSGPVSPSTARSGAGSSTGNPFFDGAPLALPPAQPSSAVVVSPTASPLARGVAAPAAFAVAAPVVAAAALAPSAPVVPAPVVVNNLGALYSKLLTIDSGVLYEDSYLQVGLKASYAGPHGQLMLFFGNKSTTPLSRVVVALPPVPQLAFQLGAVPLVIEAKKQVQVSLNITALAPFVATVQLQLGYQVGPHVHSQNLALPVVTTKFCSPPDAPLPRDVFFSQWRTLSGPPAKVSERIVRVAPLASKAPISGLLAGLRLGELPGLDPVDANFVAAATLTVAPQMSQSQRIPILVRIEVDTSSFLQFQVTVATPDATATAAIRDVLCSRLTAL